MIYINQSAQRAQAKFEHWLGRTYGYLHEQGFSRSLQKKKKEKKREIPTKTSVKNQAKFEKVVKSTVQPS